MHAGTPREFLASKKSLFPSQPLNETYLSDYLMKRPDLAKRALAKQHEESDYAEDLLNRIRHRLPDALQQALQQDRVAVGEVNDPAPNAYATPLGNSQFAVVFNTGLKSFVYRVTRALATRMAINDEDTVVDFDETCRIIADIFFWLREAGCACGPSYEITDTQVLFGHVFAVHAESFFLAHELGHVFIGLRDGSERRASSRDAWKEEFEADEFALVMCVAGSRGNDPMDSAGMAYAGAHIALHIFAGLERVGVEFEKTHPPAADRLQAIRDLLRGMCANEETHAKVIEMASTIDAVFDNILGRIADPDYEQFLERAAHQVMQELESLLDQCTGDLVPDYVTFKSRCFPLFNRLHSAQLWRKIATQAADFFRRADRRASRRRRPSEAEAMDNWRAFQKYKLFMSAVMDMHDDVRIVFEEALRK
jgi:hypothetical protein